MTTIYKGTIAAEIIVLTCWNDGIAIQQWQIIHHTTSGGKSDMCVDDIEIMVDE